MGPQSEKVAKRYGASKAAQLLTNLDSLYFSPAGLDEIIWSPFSSGSFSVFSCYKLITRSKKSTRPPTASMAWKYPMPLKVQQFAWTASLAKILTCDELSRRGQDVMNNLCKLCISEEESYDHLLLHCHFSKGVWSALMRKFGIALCMPSSFGLLLQQWLCPLLSCGKLLWRTVVLAVPWQLWLETNSRTFNSRSSTLGGVIEKVIHNILLWAGTSQQLPPLPHRTQILLEDPSMFNAIQPNLDRTHSAP